VVPVEVGVGLWCLQASALRPAPVPGLYAGLLDDARHAEQLGLHSLWLSEHHFFYDGYCPALLPAAAAALAVTERLRVGTGVLLLPLQRPERVAAAAAEVARLSGGRFDLGVGAGYRAVEFAGKGLAFHSRLARMRAGLDVVTGAGAPVWVGVSSAAAARRAGRRGLGLFLSGAFPAPVVSSLMGEHRAAWEAAGSPGGRTPPVGLLRNIWLADTPAEQAQARAWVRSSYVVYAGLGWTADQAGMDFLAGVEASMNEVERGALIGTAAEVAEALAPYRGVDVLIGRIGYDLPGPEVVREQMSRIATELVPRLDGPGGSGRRGGAVSP
jgi:alkanesulfonate monooxygenase SsuD/methylene tetrahydromethanopterin reductase-like flavin-dependent oxidoreductase (luciferase family)